MYVRQGSIVTALQSKPLSITATCFQYHEYGRRTGLKIQLAQRGPVQLPLDHAGGSEVGESCLNTELDLAYCPLATCEQAGR
jgi:hypothetical protein